MLIDNSITYRKLELKPRNKVYRIFNKLVKSPYILIAPAVILALWLAVAPMIFCVYVSFNEWDLIGNNMKFVGLANFKYIFQDEIFLKSLKNTLIYAVATVAGGLILQIIIGVFLNKNTKAHNLVQTIMYTPNMVSSVAITVVFSYLLRPEGGVFNQIIEFFGGTGIGWHTEEKTALFSIIIIALWQGLGGGVLTVISGLKSIPDYIYEAAKLDKSGRARTFTSITMPLLSPTIFYLLVNSAAGAITTFDMVKLMTNGGPNNATRVISLYIYEQGLGFMHYGRAMAASVILMLMTIGLSALSFSLTGKKIHYQ